MKSRRELLTPILVTIVLVAAFSVSVASVIGERQSIKFYIYGSTKCLACNLFKTFVKEKFGEDSIVFNELVGNKSNAEVFVSIYDLVFPEVDKSRLAIPLTVVVVDDRVAAVVVGAYVSGDFWSNVLNNSEGILLVDPSGKISRIYNQTIERKLESLIKMPVQADASTHSEADQQTKNILIPVLIAASSDSVNPCTFSVFTALLLLTMYVGGRGRMVLNGLAFISAIYLAYYLLGLGLIKMFAAIPWLKYAVIALGLTVGGYEVFTSLGGKFKSPLPKAFREATSKLIDKASSATTAPLAFAAGLIISFTLLPCSSGPYLVATSLIADLPLAERLALLGIYNLVFIAPLVLILLAMGVAEKKVRKKIKEWRTRHLHILNAIAGGLLILISFWALLV